MNQRSLLALACALCAVALGGCECGSNGDRDGSVDMDGAMCRPRGGTCDLDVECCSGLSCITSICAPTGCTAQGDACTVNEDCCSLNCSGGTCGAPIA